jgi:predicted transposase/invertase (TIGR01784 family)
MSDISELTMTRLVRFDWAIKYLLRNKANFDILEGFLSELLKTPIHIEQILESESNKNHTSDKFNRVDLLVKTEKDQHIIIEVQCSGQWDYLSRILYGTSKVVCEHLSEGDSYYKISKIISVSIVFFNLGEGQDYLYKGTTTFRGLHYGDNLSLNSQERKAYCQINDLQLETPEMIFPEYYIIKVTQFKEKVKDKLDEWIYFLKHGKIEKNFAAQGLQSASQKLDILRLSEKERREYEYYREGLRDDASFRHMVEITKSELRAEVHAEVRAEGHAEGHAEGEKKKQLQIARSLKQAGLDDAEIAKHTGLALDEIKKL